MLLQNYWIENDSQFLEKVMETNYLTLVNTGTVGVDDSVGIPKIIHFIWLGPAPLPPFTQPSINSFSRCHPTESGWLIKLWRDSDVDSLRPFPNEDIFNQTPNFGMKSDILRYEILRRYGGVYADIDYEFIQNLDNLCRGFSFFVGLSNTSACEVNNGIIGSVPGHPIFQDICHEIKQSYQSFHKAKLSQLLLSPMILSFLPITEQQQLEQNIREVTAANTIRISGPGMLTIVLCNYLSGNRVTGEIDLPTAHSKILILPIECFSPVPNKSLVNLARCENYFNLYQSISPTSSATVRHFDPLIPELRDYDYSLEAYRMKVQRYHNPDDFNDNREGYGVDWRSYDDLKHRFLSATSSIEPIAIHWWQRSWQ